jgi:hypothetical protein
MIFQKKYALNYLLKDSVVEADVDLYGGPRSPFVMLHWIRAVEPAIPGQDYDFESLVAYLAEQIVEEKKWRTIAIVHKNIVVFSTDNDVKKGDCMDGRVQQIRPATAIGLGFRPILKAIRELFRRR